MCLRSMYAQTTQETSPKPGGQVPQLPFQAASIKFQFQICQALLNDFNPLTLHARAPCQVCHICISDFRKRACAQPHSSDLLIFDVMRKTCGKSKAKCSERQNIADAFLAYATVPVLVRPLPADAEMMKKLIPVAHGGYLGGAFECRSVRYNLEAVTGKGVGQ